MLGFYCTRSKKYTVTYTVTQVARAVLPGVQVKEVARPVSDLEALLHQERLKGTAVRDFWTRVLFMDLLFIRPTFRGLKDFDFFLYSRGFLNV